MPRGKGRRRDAKSLVSTIKKLEITPTELSLALGMSRTFISDCILKDAAPMWTDLACECLLRRVRKNENKELYMMSIPKSQVSTVKAILNGLNIPITVINFLSNPSQIEGPK